MDDIKEISAGELPGVDEGDICGGVDALEQDVREFEEERRSRLLREHPTARFDPMTGEPLLAECADEDLSELTSVDGAVVDDVDPTVALDEAVAAMGASDDDRVQRLRRSRDGRLPKEPYRRPSGRGTGAARPGHMLLAGALGGIAASMATFALLVGMGVVGGQATSSRSGGAVSTPVTTNVSAPLATDEHTTIDEAVAAKCLPSVVSVSVSDELSSGIGSGVVIDTDGHVVTNWHVVEDAQMISVKVGDESYPATVVGGDESSDIAVIQVEAPAEALVPIEVGDSSSLVVGDWVMTLGSPLGLDQSASSGIVSALYRNTAMRTNSGANTLYTNLIQVDAAINGGNSGGALVNDAGQLVGINTLYANGSGMESFSGIGFAIPGNEAMEIAHKVIAGEPITHAYVGASCVTVNSDNAKSNHLGVAYGAYVAELADDGPAKAAGMRVGDVITKVGEMAVESAEDYVLAVRSCAVGDEVDVVVNRGGKEVTLKVKMGSDETLQESQREEREEAKRQQEQLQNQMLQMPDMEGWPMDILEMQNMSPQNVTF